MVPLIVYQKTFIESGGALEPSLWAVWEFRQTVTLWQAPGVVRAGKKANSIALLAGLAKRSEKLAPGE